MTNFIICDDHPMLRQGLRDLFSEDPEIKVVGEAGSYTELREILGRLACDVLLLDMNLPGRDGLDVLSTLVSTHSLIRTLVFSSFSENQYALRVLQCGAYGYLNKGSDPQTIIEAARTVAKGKKYFSPDVSQMLLESLREPMPKQLHQQLSSRELEVFLKISSGLSLTEISSSMNLSNKTVSTYRSRILGKLDLANNVGLTNYAHQHQLL